MFIINSDLGPVVQNIVRSTKALVKVLLSHLANIKASALYFAGKEKTRIFAARNGSTEELQWLEH